MKSGMSFIIVSFAAKIADQPVNLVAKSAQSPYHNLIQGKFRIRPGKRMFCALFVPVSEKPELIPNPGGNGLYQSFNSEFLNGKTVQAAGL
jgi:hypothetical protein